MKGMVALELDVVARCSRPRRAPPAWTPPATRSRGCGATSCSPARPTRRPAATPAPRWIAEHRPDWLRAAGALNECGGVSVDDRRAAALSDPGRREGLRRLPDPRSAGRGATARCRAPTTRPSWPRRSSTGSRARPDPAHPGHGALPRGGGRGAAPTTPAGCLERAGRRRPGARRGGPRGRLRPDVRPGAPGAGARHAQPGRRPRRASSTTSSRATPWSRSTAGSCRARPSPTCAPSCSTGSGRSSRRSASSS